LDLVDASDKHSFDAECVQLVSFINNILLSQKKVAAGVARKLCQFDATNERLALVTLEFLYNVSQ
jgi:hypothetical protein